MELRVEGPRPVVLVAGVARGVGLGIAAWLLSAQAGFISGQEFVVDGGMSRRMICRD